MPTYVNGVRYEGNTVSIINGVVTIDGVRQDGERLSGVVEVRIEGVLNSLKTDASVTCGDVQGSVSAGGSVVCENIHGNVSAGGSVKSGDITGNVSAGGSIKWKFHQN